MLLPPAAQRSLEEVEAYQDELEGTLAGVEAGVDALFARHAARAPAEADLEREATYERALQLDAQLGGMLGSLRALATQLNAAHARHADRADPMAQIELIVNAHHQSLVFLEDKARTLDRGIALAEAHARRAAELH